MTESKHLKARIRARMARTGERYTTARRHVVGARGTAPARPRLDAARRRAPRHRRDRQRPRPPRRRGLGGDGARRRRRARRRLHPVGVQARHHTRTLVLGFRNQWQYPGRWAAKTLDRLGVPFELHETGGARGRGRKLDAALAAGRPALVGSTGRRSATGTCRRSSGLRRLRGRRLRRGGRSDARRRPQPLAADRAARALDAARARVGSYKHRLVVPEPAAIGEERLRAAVRAGIADCVAHLGARSDSFALPAWRKWARMLTDTRNAKAWPRVFADRKGLAGALLSVWEGVEPVGTTAATCATCTPSSSTRRRRCSRSPRSAGRPAA